VNTVEEAIRCLDSLPAVHLREFELSVGRLMSRAEPHMLDMMREIVAREDLEPGIRFGAYFSLAFYYRRMFETEELKKLLKDHSHRFDSIPLNDHVKVLYYSHAGGKQNLLQALKYSRRLIGNPVFDQHIGVLHAYCDVVVSCIDEDLREEVEQDLEQANRIIDTVLDLDEGNYAKFYHTKARLLIETGRFEEAASYVHQAIKYEDSGAQDYAIRISHYRSTLLNIKYRREHEQMKRELEQQLEQAKSMIEQNRLDIEERINLQNQTAEKMKDEMVHLRQQNLQMLAFFTAIISFTIGSINIIGAQDNFYYAGLIILLLGGSLLLIHLGLGILLSTGRPFKWKANLFIAGVGMLMIAGAVCLYILDTGGI